jgi:hypothetical protein
VDDVLDRSAEVTVAVGEGNGNGGSKATLRLLLLSPGKFTSMASLCPTCGLCATNGVYSFMLFHGISR